LSYLIKLGIYYINKINGNNAYTRRTTSYRIQF
jgi:hypothetical protein